MMVSKKGEANGQFRSAHSTHSAADFSTVKRADSLSHTRDGCPLCLTVGETFISKIFPVCVGYRGIRNPAPPTPRGGPLFLASPPSPIPPASKCFRLFHANRVLSYMRKVFLKWAGPPFWTSEISAYSGNNRCLLYTSDAADE